MIYAIITTVSKPRATGMGNSLKQNYCNEKALQEPCLSRGTHHYLFDIRNNIRWDLIAFIIEPYCNSLSILKVLLRLWKHECKRVIADRFTSPDDVAWFDQTLADLAQQDLGVDARASVEVREDAYFVDFLQDAPEATGATRHKTIRIIL